MKIAVVSDGGWGTALALTLLKNGHGVSLWGPFPEYILETEEKRENNRFLPGVELPEELLLTSDLEEALCDAGLIVLASPSQFQRSVLGRVARATRTKEAIFVNVAKGIEVSTLKRMSELSEEILGTVPYAVLSGPSHAEEVAHSVPTAVVTASYLPEVARKVQEIFMNTTFRVYTSDDVIGVELGGSLKNVLALGVGICDGMDYGDNTKAALMTRGIAEMARLGQALGGRRQTFGGLSGVGDLIVTAMSRHSRNRYVGQELGKGRELPAIIESMNGKVAEGVTTAASAYRLAVEAGVEIPITAKVYAVLYEGLQPQEAVASLMSRDPKPEQKPAES